MGAVALLGMVAAVYLSQHRSPGLRNQVAAHAIWAATSPFFIKYQHVSSPRGLDTREEHPMESKVKLLGHPVHPILIVFPLGLLIMALIFDVIYFATDNTAFATAAYWDIAAGSVGGLLAAVFGLIDWLNIPSGTRAKSVGMWHGIGNVVVVALFTLSWWLRYRNATHTPSTTAFILALLGIGIGAIAGWLGGEMVNRLGVGVDPGAHLDAPSSLSGVLADSNLQRAETLREREVGGRT
jgi:uncharacterized membrane protein